MLQNEQVPHKYSEVTANGSSKNLNGDTSLALISSDCELEASFTFEAVTPNVFRTTFTTLKHPLPPHPSARQPEARFGNVVPTSSKTDHRKRFDLGGDEEFPMRVTATVDWKDSPVVSLYLDGDQKPIHRDLNFRSYALDSQGICHYTFHKRGTLHAGLGEKAAPFDLSNRGFLLAATDSFGYDVYKTDPLYKHIPLVINVTPKGCIAMFSTSHSRGTWLIGSEVDGLWGHYKVYRQAHGGLEEYLIVGHTVADVVKSYAQLVGFPKLVPRWAMGYIGGGMLYSMLDEPRAADAHLDFFEKLRKHDIPCSAFQMSSGYTVAESEPKTRNVFTWNAHRFPDPKDFTAKCNAQGIRMIANIKPYLLANHPDYNKLVRGGGLFKDPTTNAAGVCRLWSAGGGESGEGSHLDFTSKTAYQWWYDGVKALRKVGISAAWNDNNEWSVPNDRWQLALETGVDTNKEVGNEIGLWGRSMHCELMAKASHDALVEAEPGIRPFVLTRSATAGTMRYANSSWSGDNVTSWDGMKGANSLSLNAGLSLIQSYGHDIGGFEGPQPTSELLLRWIQLGVHSPRFAINCYKTSPEDNLLGEVIEPFQFPEITPLVRAAIKRRYEILPYLYSQQLLSHLTATPPQRWIGWGYEHDPEVWSSEVKMGDTQYWLGDSLLVGGVYEPGTFTARVYLPKPADYKPTDSLTDTSSSPPAAYINLNAPYNHLPGGLWTTLSSPWKSSIPLLGRIGGCLQTGKSIATGNALDTLAGMSSLAADNLRGVEIFPPLGDSHRVYSNTWYEDDGLTIESEAKISTFTVKYEAFIMEVKVWFETGSKNEYVPEWRDLEVVLPVGDERVVVSGVEGREVTDLGRDGRGRRKFVLGLGL